MGPVANVVKIELESAHGARIESYSREYLVNMATVTGTGTITATVTGAIPAGAFNVFVSAFVKTVLAGTSLTTWSLGVTSDTDRYATGKAKTAGVTVTAADYAADNALFDVHQTALDILFTGAAGQFDTGEVRLCVFYQQVTPPTS